MPLGELRLRRTPRAVHPPAARHRGARGDRVGPAADVQARLAKGSLKGEFVLLIAPKDFVL